VIETLQFWGIQVSVKLQPNVKVAAFKGARKYEFAQPDKEGAAK